MKGKYIIGAVLFISLLFVSCATSENGDEYQPDYNPAVQRENLVAEYLFDENADDTSGNGNHGVVSGATLVNDRFGRSNHAYRFDSAESNEIVCADAPELNPTDALSVTLWMRPTAFDVNGRMISKRGSDGGGGTGGWEIDTWNYSIRFTRHGYVMLPYSTDSLSMNEWIFVGLTFVDGEQHIYVNGEHVGNTSYDMFNATDVDLKIGNNSTFDSYFSGDIDDVRLYNSVLSGNDIETLYHAGDWDLP
jgi:hypothetical protein